MQPRQGRRAKGRSRRLFAAMLGAFGVSVLVAVAPWVMSSASAQSVCYDDLGNVVPCPTVPPTQPPPNTQPPPTLPTVPPTQATSPPVTAGTVPPPPPTSPPAT